MCVHMLVCVRSCVNACVFRYRTTSVPFLRSYLPSFLRQKLFWPGAHQLGCAGCLMLQGFLCLHPDPQDWDLFSTSTLLKGLPPQAPHFVHSKSRKCCSCFSWCIYKGQVYMKIVAFLHWKIISVEELIIFILML